MAGQPSCLLEFACLTLRPCSTSKLKVILKRKYIETENGVLQVINLCIEKIYTISAQIGRYDE